MKAGLCETEHVLIQNVSLGQLLLPLVIYKHALIQVTKRVSGDNTFTLTKSEHGV